MSLYRNILKQAAQIVWRHKFLWFFGFFAAFLGGFGEYELMFNRADSGFAQNFLIKFQRFQELNIFSWEFWGNAVDLFQASPISMLIVIGMLLILLALIIFLIWLAVVSQEGIIFRTGQLIESKKNSSKLNIQKGLESGMNHFWPVLALNILSKLLLFLIFFFLSLVFLFLIPQSGQLWIEALYVLLFIIFLPIALIAAFILKYSICYVIIGKESLVSSIEKGWKLFLRNWLITLEMALILFFITFAATVVLLFASLIIAIPVYFLIDLLVVSGAGAIGFWVVVAMLLLMALCVAVIGGTITSFRISSWTTLFDRISSQEGGLSKIVRWAEKIKS